MKPHFKKLAACLATGSALAITGTQAANSFYAPGDLVLFFQKQGSSNTVYANLGSAATLYRGAAAGPDAATQTNILNLNSTLTSAFGAGWQSDTGIYAGVAGVFSTNSTNTTAAPNGDPYRTLYISSARNSVATVGQADSVGWDLTAAGNTNMTTAASGIQTQNNVLENSFTTAVAIATVDISQIDEQNPLTSAGVPPVTIQEPAMGGALNGGIQQQGGSSAFGTFDGVGQVEFALDLYRVLARNNVSGQVAGGLRVGSYEGTVTVGTDGSVSFLAVPEPSSILLSGLAAGALVTRRRRNA